MSRIFQVRAREDTNLFLLEWKMLSYIKSVAATAVAITVIIGGAACHLGEALEEHRNSIMAYVQARVGPDRHTAEDVVQSVSYTVAAKASKGKLRPFRDREDFRSYLFVTARNKILHIRRSHARAHEAQGVAQALHVSAERIRSSEDRELCDLILNRINPRYAEALRVQHLGYEGVEPPAYISSRAMAAAQKIARKLGLDSLS